jgi:hypothetical protein
LVDIENNEIGIFEVRQEQHTRHHARYDPPFAFSRVFGGSKAVANDIIEDCGTHQNHNIIAATFVIEKQAEKRYVYGYQLFALINQVIDRHKHQEQQQKLPAVEQQRCIRVVNKYPRKIVQKFHFSIC